jgi:hypothetical protein
MEDPPEADHGPPERLYSHLLAVLQAFEMGLPLLRGEKGKALEEAMKTCNNHLKGQETQLGTRKIEQLSRLAAVAADHMDPMNRKNSTKWDFSDSNHWCLIKVLFPVKSGREIDKLTWKNADHALMAAPLRSLPLARDVMLPGLVGDDDARREAVVALCEERYRLFRLEPLTPQERYLAVDRLMTVLRATPIHIEAGADTEQLEARREARLIRIDQLKGGDDFSEGDEGDDPPEGEATLRPPKLAEVGAAVKKARLTLLAELEALEWGAEPRADFQPLRDLLKDKEGYDGRVDAFMSHVTAEQVSGSLQPSAWHRRGRTPRFPLTAGPAGPAQRPPPGGGDAGPGAGPAAPPRRALRSGHADVLGDAATAAGRRRGP